jgi:hypothetical protein
MSQGRDQMMQERRRSERRKERRAIRISWREGELQYREDTWTVSISQFGCGVESRHNIAPSTAVVLEQEGREFTGRISYVLRSSAASHYELGIGFDADGSEFWGTTF